MRKRRKLGRPSHGTVVAYLALFVALGGSAYAAKQLPKNSVGSPQIKKNAVKTGDIARNAVKAGKLAREAVKAGKLAKNAVPTNRLRDNAATGAKVNEATLGTVPTAQTANAANTANVANSLAPPENWHEVGTPGEPGFLNSWSNRPGPSETAAFYKDQEDVVHLRGGAESGTAGTVFRLPVGYRPPSGKIIEVPGSCSGGIYCGSGVARFTIDGPGLFPEGDGAVLVPLGATLISFSGITFRAES